MRELRFHGRGGQGTVVASKLLAVALFREGRQVQSFPAFGVERRGAPVTAFLRVSDAPILLRCEITQPDDLVILDPTLIGVTDVTAGLKRGGAILINSPAPPDAYPDFTRSFRVATVDASGIAQRFGLGSKTQPIVNTAILGALAVTTELVTLESVCDAIREEVPQKPEANMNAARAAADAVVYVERQKGQNGQKRQEGQEGQKRQKIGWATSSAPSAPSAALRVTPVAVSNTTTLVANTGSWKYIRPVYQDRVAPCNEACPVGIDIEGYLNLLREDRFDEACDLLLRENPLPAVTGRVCHHPCEISCNREPFDEGVAVHAVERALGDRILELPVTGPTRTSCASVGIVGSGPAGLSCAYHAARLGYSVTVFEAAPEPGGMLRSGIPEYRLPRAVLDRQIAWLRAHGITIECGVRIGTDVPWWSLLGAFDAVFLAVGAQHSKGLGVPGEKLTGVESGLNFLKRVNAGARPSLGQRVVIVGGGNTAIDCARMALRLGAEATVLYRRTRAEMPAIPDEVEEAEREGVRFVFLGAPLRLLSGNGRVQAIECRRMELGLPDASGRRAPVPVEGARFTLPADTVLSAVGELADLESLPGEIDRIPSGVLVGEYGQTTRPAIFAGGDMTHQLRTVADAIGAGKCAAIGIDRYLRTIAGRPLEGPDAAALRYGSRGNLSVTRWRGDDPVSRTAPANQVVGPPDLNYHHFVHRARWRDARLPLPEGRRAFGEVNLGLTPQAALEEARRCLNCGVCNGCDLCLVFCPDAAISRVNGGYAVDLDHCKGCGVCAKECPRGAIVMTREEP